MEGGIKKKNNPPKSHLYFLYLYLIGPRKRKMQLVWVQTLFLFAIYVDFYAISLKTNSFPLSSEAKQRRNEHRRHLFDVYRQYSQN